MLWNVIRILENLLHYVDMVWHFYREICVDSTCNHVMNLLFTKNNYTVVGKIDKKNVIAAYDLSDWLICIKTILVKLKRKI